MSFGSGVVRGAGPSGPEAVHSHGVENVIAAAAPTAPIVLVTQIYITRPEAFERVRDVIVARRRGEEALRSSLVVCPPLP